MNKCLNCPKLTDNPKFCSRNCAATYNNKRFPKRNPENNCRICGKEILVRYTFCSDECRKIANNDYDSKFVFIENSSVKRSLVKKRYLKLVSNECSICGQLPEWCNKKLVLVLDHINGINDDNRISNLRLLCPNCNSQTETFSGRNIKRIEKQGTRI
jgi:predicted nucleic acid-binding Zn ribbon protein